MKLNNPNYLNGLKSNAREIDGSVNKKQIVLPKALISNGITLTTLSDWIPNSGKEYAVTVNNNINPFTNSSLDILETVAGASVSVSKVVDINLLGLDTINLFIYAKKGDGVHSYGNIQLDLYNHPTTTANRYTIQIKSLMNPYDNLEWHNISFKVSDLIPAGTILATDLIKKIKFTFFGAAGSLLNIKIAGIKGKMKARKAIAFSFDDGNETDYTVAYNVLKQYNFSGTSYIISEDIGKKNLPSGRRLDLIQMQEMYNNGWTFGNHGKDYFNFVTESTLSEAEVSIKTCRDFLYSNGFINALDHLAYPHGEYNEAVKSIMNKYGIHYGRTVITDTQKSPVENMQEIRCIPMKKTFEENKILIDSVMQSYQGGCLNLYAHELVDEQDIKISATTFAQVVQYVHDNYRQYVTTIPQWVKDYETGTYI